MVTEVMSQTIKGIIYDLDSHEPIPYASIYYNNTYTGTYADSEGYFELKSTINSYAPLIISAVGYQTEIIETGQNSESHNFIVYLRQASYVLDEVFIWDNVNDRQRRRYLKKFKSEFLGVSRNARKCIIENEEEIKFHIDENKNILYAYSREPLQITNKALGYEIKYFLDHFEYHQKVPKVWFAGQYHYSKLVNLEELNLRRIQNKREDTFLGSRQHFIKSLYNNRLIRNHFIIKNYEEKLIDYDDLVRNCADVTGIAGNKCISYHEPIYIYYKNKWIGGFDFTEYSSKKFIDASGYFDPKGISWFGPISEKRIGDQLPFEYQLE